MPGMEHYLSLGATILLFSLVGLYATRMVKSLSDYLLGGRKLGPVLVAGATVGGFVGGTVTIGTAQMAYCYGVSGLWFTLGAGVACLTLYLFLAGPLREREVDTIAQFLSRTYGRIVEPWVALFVALGMFIQVSVQMVAAVPLITSIFPVKPLTALLIFTLLTIMYVLGGGFWGSSLVGLMKLGMLSLTLFASAAVAWELIGGVPGMASRFSMHPWFNMFPRGVGPELAGGLSAVIGFISTQACLQPVFAGRSVKAARVGALLSSLFIPCFGAAGVLVGMYMRAVEPSIEASRALPVFMLGYLPHWLGGAGLATLFISLVLTSSAMALGISTLFSQDIYARFRPVSGSGERLLAARLTVVLTSLLGCVFAYSILGDLILDWTYLSNALRGVTVFIPLVAAVFMGRWVAVQAGVWAVSVPPLFTVAWALFFPGHLHPLYVGLPVSLLIIIMGMIRPKLFGHSGGVQPGA